jgi:foldase protein PrsA
LVSYNNGGPGNLLDRIVSEKLVELEAKRRNIVVRKEEIDAEVLKFEKEAIENGRTLIQLLEENDQTLAQFEKDTKVRLTIYKILGSSTTFNEDEVDRIIEENPWLYKDDEELEAVREEIKDLLIQRRLDDSYDTWILDAKAQSKVDYFIRL